MLRHAHLLFAVCTLARGAGEPARCTVAATPAGRKPETRGAHRTGIAGGRAWSSDHAPGSVLLGRVRAACWLGSRRELQSVGRPGRDWSGRNGTQHRPASARRSAAAGVCAHW